MFFNDPRLDELSFRYLARNHPESLSNKDKQRWEEFRQHRLFDESGGGSVTMPQFRQILDELEVQADTTSSQLDIIKALRDYASGLED